jgi:hypothetical protein
VLGYSVLVCWGLRARVLMVSGLVWKVSWMVFMSSGDGFGGLLMVCRYHLFKAVQALRVRLACRSSSIFFLLVWCVPFGRNFFLFFVKFLNLYVVVFRAVSL